MRADWDELFVIDHDTWWERRTKSERDAWRYWLRRHTIDPNDVSVPGYIAIFRSARQIHYAAFSNRYPPDWPEAVRVVQLEAEPSRFPR